MTTEPKPCLTDYLIAWRAGEPVEIKMAGVGGKDWTKPHTENDIAARWLHSPSNVQIKPSLKPVDMSVLIDSGIDCELSGYRDFINFNVAPLFDIDEDNLYLLRQAKGADIQYPYCRPRLCHWHNWRGGECPLPEGLLVKVELRNGDSNTLSSGQIAWGWCGTAVDMGDVIAFRVLGCDDEHCMPWEVE